MSNCMLSFRRNVVGINRIVKKTLGSSPTSTDELANLSRIDSPLTDTFGRFHNYLRISLTEKCNLRCVYCMPAEGVTLTKRDNLLSFEERMRVIDLFARLGVDKVRFTGGEPTLSKDLVPLIAKCKSYESIKSVGMTTNGILLGNRLLNELKLAGLSSVNISLDSLNADRFAMMSRRDKKGLMKVLSAIFSAVSIGLKVKINCVLMRGVNDDELTQFIEMTKDMDIDVRFIELMPFDGNEWSPTKFMGYMEAVDRCNAQGYLLTREAAELRDKHDTTKWYRLEGYAGRVGFISSMSSQFCGGCNRLRITADGKVKVCLFGEEGLSLRDSFRIGLTQEEIIQQIADSVRAKKKQLGGHVSAEDISKDTNRPMILIGG